ncbi:MAG: sulfurtransferase [Kiloniellaceae bacterium]|nr:sulfurtransferase [Kiloniellaceae bacterium]
MPDQTTLSLQALFDRIGTAEAPDVIDARTDDDFAADPRLIPAAIRRPGLKAADWAGGFAGRDVVVYCERGLKISQGAAAWLRHVGARAASLEGGFQAWRAGGLPLVPADKLPPRDGQGRTLWVTRSRPKIDRIACPWLIRRFVDPAAVFLFVTPAEVTAVAERFGATPFDVEGVFWSHRGALCTFDAMVEVFGLATAPLKRLATIVRGADTAQPGLAPESAGLLAASLGLSQIYEDDLAQLAAGLPLYDAFYRWLRDAEDETHNWPAVTPEVRDAQRCNA